MGKGPSAQEAMPGMTPEHNAVKLSDFCFYPQSWFSHLIICLKMKESNTKSQTLLHSAISPNN